MRSESNDRRVRRTKKLLKNGLIQLMQTKPAKDISVRELSDLVDINRGTFYLYYRDIYDMLLQIENELFENIENIIKKHLDNFETYDALLFLTELLTFVKENSDLFKLLLGKNGDILFQQRLGTVVRENYRCVIQEIKGSMLEVDFDYRYSFAVFGGIGLIHYWLERGCSEPVENLAASAAHMIENLMKT